VNMMDLMDPANARACERPAPGGPGIEPRWTSSVKDSMGTAYSSSSHVWYTLSRGVLNEVYYPTIDRPQIRDLQFLVTDGETFFHDERHDMESQVEVLSEHALGMRVTSTDPEGRYRIHKEVIADPHLPVVLVHTRFEVSPDIVSRLKLFVLCAPHLETGGWGNNARIIELSGRRLFCGYRQKGTEETWLALSASVPFLKMSCGYVGVNDGWTDLTGDYSMDWEFDCALDGNIALTAEVDLSKGAEFTLALGFGEVFHNAVSTLFQSLGVPFERQRARFVAQWERTAERILPLEKVAGDGGALLRRSQSLLLAHEDKLYPGAIIASLSIPWGNAKGDDNGLGGYHLVWTRDLVQSATGLLATGNTATPLRALIYLAASQLADGGFHQNFWVDGEAYFQGVQLDEVAFPILLAWKLHEHEALQDFDPYPMVRRAAAYLIRHGPATPQDRWEEAGGYSPATLASNIAALICAASLARERGEGATACFIEEYADFLECHLERWTVTNRGSLVRGITRHYIRIHPVQVGDVQPNEDPDSGTLGIANRAPGEQAEFPAREIVDAGFLELVRYGIRSAADPIIEDSLKVVDSVLKVDTPYGPAWRRYNHDGYGQRADGGPYEGWGVGRAWPLLTGERGHYELAAGRPVEPFIRAMEGFAHGIGLLPEQVWDEEDRPQMHLLRGRTTGSAMPLMWAHAEYIKLLRSASDGRAFDLVPKVGERYLSTAPNDRLKYEIWKPNRQVRSAQPGWTLRIVASEPFALRWTRNDWQDVEEHRSEGTGLEFEFLDIAVLPDQRAPIRFTFYWLQRERWEGRDYEVMVEQN
jgi:glucoamylase